LDLNQLLGRERNVTLRDATRHLDALIELWNQQARLIKAPVRDRQALADFDSLAADLPKLQHWYNPTATGRRLREALYAVNAPPLKFEDDLGDLVEPIDDERFLVSPEGRVAMWVIAAGILQRDLEEEAEDHLWLTQQQRSDAWATLTDIYRQWNRQRLRNVTGLLREETATLRPSVIALLLVLLINRNTAKERRLPAPADSRWSNDISRALSEPAIAFVQALSGDRDSRADPRGLDLYRGWAIGEVSRRLGSGLHREDGIWIDESAVPAAENRLIAALVNRPPGQLAEVESALDVLLREYDRVRPQLTSLGIAYELPSVTRRLASNIHMALQAKRDMQSAPSVGEPS